MKLATQISILVISGLAIHGLTQNGMELGRLYKSRCECCGKPGMENRQSLFTSEPVRHSNEGRRDSYREVDLSPEKGGVPRLPKPEQGDRQPPAGVNGPVDPMVQDILEIRQRMGGSSIASILGSDLDGSNKGVSEGIVFQQAIREYAEKTNYEQVSDEAPSHFNENQEAVSPGAGLSVSDLVRWLNRFRF